MMTHRTSVTTGIKFGPQKPQPSLGMNISSSLPPKDEAKPLMTRFPVRPGHGPQEQNVKNCLPHLEYPKGALVFASQKRKAGDWLFFRSFVATPSDDTHSSLARMLNSD